MATTTWHAIPVYCQKIQKDGIWNEIRDDTVDSARKVRVKWICIQIFSQNPVTPGDKATGPRKIIFFRKSCAVILYSTILSDSWLGLSGRLYVSWNVCYTVKYTVSEVWIFNLLCSTFRSQALRSEAQGTWSNLSCKCKCRQWAA